jgi:hypothetical protein
MTTCGSEHPDPSKRGITCDLPTQPDHEWHQNGYGGSTIAWRNLLYDVATFEIPPERQVPPTQQGINVALNGFAQRATRPDRAVRPTRPTRRSVGRSSVLPRDVQAAEEGMQAASGALEDEWIECAYEVVSSLRSQGIIRITSDDIWDGTDQREVFTEHPKGMAGLLRRLIKDSVIRPVPKEDPDHNRPSIRSNDSRRLRVYEIQNP